MIDPIVPVFHLADLKNGQHRDALRDCLTEMGVFYLKEDSSLKAAHRLARDMTMDFFKKGTIESKATVTNFLPNMRRGFSALESESTARSTNSGDYTDYAMVYSMGISHNLFPSSDFEDAWTSWFGLYYSVSRETAKIVLEVINAQCGDEIESFLDCDPVLRFRYYPETPEDRCAERQRCRMAPHYDLSIISIILQDPCANGLASLQVEVDGSFVDLPPAPDCLVVICGSIATLVSGGKIKAPKHQVVAPNTALRVGSARTSSVFFLRPKPEFEFSVLLAKACGLDVSLTGDKSTFREWCGANYMEMHVKKGSDVRPL